MKPAYLILFIVITFQSFCQDVPASLEQQLQEQSVVENNVEEDDGYQQELEQFRKYPINLNKADPVELRSLNILNEIQLNNLFSYLLQCGELIHIYELQAIPGWDPVTIKKILPFIRISPDKPFVSSLLSRFRNGEHSIFMRTSRQFGSEVINDSDQLGGSMRLMARYKYDHKGLLSAGFTGEKDAGEQFFRGAQRLGFDFYSAHIFIRKLGKIEQFALGDYTVNLGQGLIQWQSLAFGKGGDPINIKSQSPKLKRYNSTGEFYFFRGIAISARFKNILLTAFSSYRKLNANLGTDSSTNGSYFSSLLTSGYSRTRTEIADRHTLTQLSTGGNLEFRKKRFQIGINSIVHLFSLPFRKPGEPYNKYSIRDKKHWNASVDYSYSFRNLHLFGEIAIDKYFKPARLFGMLVSLDPRVDLSILYRRISKEYQVLYAKAVTENSLPTNESGLYAGISVRPFNGLLLNAYADLYKFPWLKFSVDAPSRGRDFLFQLNYSWDKTVELNLRFRNESKEENAGDGGNMNKVIIVTKKSWRTQLNYKYSSAITIRSRIEALWYRNSSNIEAGFLAFIDMLFHPMVKPYGASLRLQYFETDGYDSRIYAYENDVLYSYSIPPFSGKGYRYYLNINLKASKALTCWLRFARTASIKNYNDGSLVNKRTGTFELKFQVQYHIYR